MATREAAGSVGSTGSSRTAERAISREQQAAAVLHWLALGLGVLAFILASVAIARAAAKPAGLSTKGPLVIAVVFLAPFVALAYAAAVNRTGNAAKITLARRVALAVCSIGMLAAVPITAKLFMDSLFSCNLRVPGCPAPTPKVQGLYLSATYCVAAAGLSLLGAVVLLYLMQLRTDTPRKGKTTTAPKKGQP